eukprot:TRINITY_DN5867_c0_g2_i3.p1 TRINITY_DN5867_c0_g2~~TRINITY_DN5867_c0_g2_i3.p1  ORF type:complete len:2025 (+),score=389.71 TRINITY_DN5867_c0_g2_i3:74-6076(+)
MGGGGSTPACDKLQDSRCSAGGRQVLLTVAWQCEELARACGGSGWVTPISSSKRPPGCYYDTTNNKMYFNNRSSTRKCSRDYECWCCTDRCKTLPPTSWPTVPPTTESPSVSPSMAPSVSPPTASPSASQCAYWVEFPCRRGYARTYQGDCPPGNGGRSGGDELCGYDVKNLTGINRNVVCVDCEQHCCEKVVCENVARPGTVQPHADYTNCWGMKSSQPCNYTCDPGWTPTSAGLAHPVQCNGVSTNLSAPKRALWDFTKLGCEPQYCTQLRPGTIAKGVDYHDCIGTGKTSGQTCQVQCHNFWYTTSVRTAGDDVLNLTVCELGVFDASVSITCEPWPCTQGPLPDTSDTTQWPPGFASTRVAYSHCNALSSGQTCAPVCPAGYTLRPAAGFELQCNGTGYDAQFQGGRGTRCVPNDCSDGPTDLTYDPNIADPGAASDGYSDCTKETTGETCVPQCKDGWYADPSDFPLTCVGGRYNATSVCKPHTCSQPTGTTENASVADFRACSNLTSDQLCVPPCKAGYEQQGTLVMVCNAKGEYPAPKAVVNCTAYKCTMGPNETNRDQNATYEGCTAQETDRTCVPDCDSPGQKGGRTLMGVDGPDSGFLLVCYPDKPYDAHLAFCDEHLCLQGPAGWKDPHADYTICTRMRTGQHCSPECAPGYSLNGSFVLVCLRDQTFAAEAAVCEPNWCFGGPDPEFGIGVDPRADYRKCDKSVTDMVCKPDCAEGWYLSDPQGFTLVCSDRNRTFGPKAGFKVATTQPFQYRNTEVRCLPYACNMGRSNSSDEHIDPNRDCDRMSSGQLCMPTCTQGYSLQPPGAISMVCDAANTFNFWSMGRKSCVANDCGHCILNTTQFLAANPSAKDDPQYKNLTECRGGDPNGNYSECYNSTTDQQCSARCRPGFRPYPESFTLVCDEHGRYEAFGQTCDQMFCRPSCAVLHNRCHRCNYSMSTAAVSTAAQDNVMCQQIRTFDPADYMFGRPLVLAKLGCDTMYWDSVNETATEWMLCPTALSWSAGSPHLRHIRGCIVGNAVFCVAFALAVTAGLAVLGALRAGRGIDRRVVSTVIEKFRPARVVSLITLPHSFVASGTAYCAVQLFWRSPLAQDRSIAASGVVLLIAHPVLLWLLVLRPGKFRAQSAVYSDADKHPIRSFLAGKQEWRATDRDPDFVHVHGFSFIWWRPGFRAWMLAESAQSIIVGVASGWATRTPEECNWRNTALIAVLGVYALALLIARPARAALSNGFMITTAVSLCLAIVFLYLGFQTFPDVSNLVGQMVRDASIGGTVDCTIFTKDEGKGARDFSAYDAHLYNVAQSFLITAAFSQVLKGMSDFTAQFFNIMTVAEIARIEREAAEARAKVEEAQREMMAEMLSGKADGDGAGTYNRQIDDLDEDFSLLTDAKRRWRLLRRAVLFGEGVTGMLVRNELEYEQARAGRFNIAGTDVRIPVWQRKAAFRMLQQSDAPSSVLSSARANGVGRQAASQGDAPLELAAAGDENGALQVPASSPPAADKAPRPRQTARVLGDADRLRQLWLEDAGRAGRKRFDHSLRHLAGATGTVLERGLAPLGDKGLGALLEFPTGEKVWWPVRCLEGFSPESEGQSTPEREEPPALPPAAPPAKQHQLAPGGRVRIRREESLVRAKWTEGGGRGAAHYFERHLLARLGAEGVVSRVDGDGSGRSCRAALVRFADGYEDWWPADCIEAVPGTENGTAPDAQGPAPADRRRIGSAALGPGASAGVPAAPPPPGTRLRVPADAGRVRAAWAAAGGELGVRYFMQRLSRTLGRSGEVVQTRASEQDGSPGRCAVLLRIGKSEEWWPLSALVPCGQHRASRASGNGLAHSVAAQQEQQAAAQRRDLSAHRAQWLARGSVEAGGVSVTAPPAFSFARPDRFPSGSAVLLRKLQSAPTAGSRSEADTELYVEPLLDPCLSGDHQEAPGLSDGWSPLLPAFSFRPEGGSACKASASGVSDLPVAGGAGPRGGAPPHAALRRASPPALLPRTSAGRL